MNGSNSDNRTTEKRIVEDRAVYRPGATARPFGWWAARQCRSAPTATA